MRETRYRDAAVFQAVGQIMRRGLAIHRGVRRQDDFAHLIGARAVDEAGDVQVLRPDAVERRKDPAEHVKAALEDAGALQRPQIGHVLDHTDQRLIAPRIGADATRVHRIEVAAAGALAHVFRCRREGRTERDQQRLLALEKMQRSAARRTRPQAGKLRQQLDQAVDVARAGGLGPRSALETFQRGHQNGSFIPGGN